MLDGITQNLNPAFEIRAYQEDAFARFISNLHLPYSHSVFDQEDAFARFISNLHLPYSHSVFDFLPVLCWVSQLEYPSTEEGSGIGVPSYR